MPASETMKGRPREAAASRVSRHDQSLGRMRRGRDARGLAGRHGGLRHPSSGLAGAVDRRLMRRLTRRWPGPVDELLVMLSRAGEHAVLWLGIAAAGALFGGSRGRRAAKQGVLALGCTSATVNGLKLVVDRRRPAPRRVLRRRPRTSSFPSGHAASAFAFATAVSREVPGAAPALFPLAASVAYSRVYLGVHYPSDVVAGGALGTAVGSAARPVARRLGLIDRDSRRAVAPQSRSEAVLLVSPHAGNSRGLARARCALNGHGIHVAKEIDIEHVDHLPALLRTAGGEPRLVIAAGGDGTVGACAAQLAGADNLLGILPLGTGNDFARALDIPLNPGRAADLIASGEISSVDLGLLTRTGQPPAYFAHAASVGLNVSFAKLATRASVRARLGRLTYLAAAAYATRERTTFTCTLHHHGGADELTLLQLAVISAPVIGGSLGLSVRSPYPDDHRLDVLAIEDVPPLKLIRAGVFLLLGIKRPVPGVRALHLDTLAVDSDHPLALALDGELDGALPGQFQPLAGALRVITPGSHTSQDKSLEMRDDRSPG
jgi:diacylglycerol kinase family enzyme/membrane-associated phospholipid phosphatase